MVLRNRDRKMASEQPVKKKLRITDEEETRDEPDFLHNTSDNGMRTDLSRLHLSLPGLSENEHPLNNEHPSPDCNLSETLLHKQSVNYVINRTLPSCSSSEASMVNSVLSRPVVPSETHSISTNYSSVLNGVHLSLHPNFNVTQNVPKQVNVPPPLDSGVHMQVNSFISVTSNLYTPLVNSNQSSLNDIIITNSIQMVPSVQSSAYNSSMTTSTWANEINFTDQIVPNACNSITMNLNQDSDDVTVLQSFLIKQCLCGVSESTIRKPFQLQHISDGNKMRVATLSEWPAPKTLQFLSNLQLLFDVYLKQNNKGHICSRICDICDHIVRNEHNMIDQMIELSSIRNKYINYLLARVLSSFLIIAKTNINNEWLETIVRFLATEPVDYIKMNFSLEVIKRVVEWKDVDIHVLEESDIVAEEGAGTSRIQDDEIEANGSCSTMSFTDHESFDTSGIKCLIIKSLEYRWPELIKNIQQLITQNSSTQSQNCVLTFLSLWESIISVKANLSVIDTKPFYAHLESFVMLLNHNLPAIVWRQLLSLFNEVLCYGSTLALQDMLPEETCTLAHLIVRYVKDFRLLDSLPYRRSEGQTVHSFVGTIQSTEPSQPNIDKTLLQKMVLLVLKSVAITVKETRCDSSDSSIGSDDYDFYQDMQLIERSIRDVLKKVDVFIKNSLDFHPETTFSKILIHLFSDQDDYMIESMVCTLDITVGIYYRNSVFPDLIAMLSPSFTFIEFLKVVSHDSDVLLDYLVSNETCFLLYLLRFLKYVRRNWSTFVISCETSSGASMSRSANELDETMTVLIRLRHQISRLVNKQLFPYNINPVLRLLEVCESLYEGNELS